jgi:hypothetical protein
MIGIAAFDPSAYEELRDDPAATLFAVVVVIAATLLAALGGLLWVLVAAAPPEIYEVDVGRFFGCGSCGWG